MLNLLYSWKESLKILIPKNLKLFLLVTLGLAINTYKILLIYFWWLPLLMIYFRAHGYFILFISPFLLSFFSVIIARPSLERKDWRYFMHKTPYVVICVIFLIIFGILLGFFDVVVIKLLQTLLAFYVKLQYTSSLFFADTQRALLEMRLMSLSIGIQRYSYSVSIGMFIMPLLFLNWFFVLDISSHCWFAVPQCFKAFVRAFFNSFKFYIYNLPLLLTVGLLVAAGCLAILLKPYLIIAGLLILPLYMCLLSNIYTKRVHEQMDLYLKE